MNMHTFFNIGLHFSLGRVYNFLSSQLKYQKELERLEKENKELRKQSMLKGDKFDGRRQMKVCLTVCVLPTFIRTLMFHLEVVNRFVLGRFG